RPGHSPSARRPAVGDRGATASARARQVLDPRARRRAPPAHGHGHPAPRAVGRTSRRGRDLLGRAVKITVWGTRGSQASPGPDTIRYGGNTSCVELQAEPDADARVVLDAGTGLRRLGAELSPDVRR